MNEANLPRGAQPPTFVAVIPAHNESATIAEVVSRTLAFVDAVIVVDDGSTDPTGSLASAAGATVHRMDPNVGKGAALAYGLQAAMALTPGFIITLDGDGEHDPDDLPALLAARNDAEIVLGCRHVYRSGARRLLNGLALFWFRMLHPEIRDTICGYRLFQQHTIAQVHNDAGGFVYEHEVLLRAILNGISLKSVPIQTEPNDRSHVTPQEILRANNHFDRWVLAHLRQLPLPLWRRVLLALGCGLGLMLGTPLEWALRRRDARRD